MVTIMTGEIDFDNVFFPVREEITPKGNISLLVSGDNITMPDLKYADLSTYAKAQYLPGTAHIIGFFARSNEMKSAFKASRSKIRKTALLLCTN